MPKKTKCLREFLLEDEDIEFIELIDDYDFDEDITDDVDEEWARAIADLEELGFTEKID